MTTQTKLNITEQFLVGADTAASDKDYAGLPVRSILFKIESLDEIPKAGGVFLWVLEHMSPILAGYEDGKSAAVLEDFYLDEEAEGVRVVLSEPMTIPEKVYKLFGVRVVPWDQDAIHAEKVAQNWLSVPFERRDDVLAYIADMTKWQREHPDRG